MSTTVHRLNDTPARNAVLNAAVGLEQFSSFQPSPSRHGELTSMINLVQTIVPDTDCSAAGMSHAMSHDS